MCCSGSSEKTQQDQGTPQKTCCQRFRAWVTEHRWWYLALILAVMIVGIILFALGIKNILSGEKTTRVAYYNNYWVKNYYDVEIVDMQQTVVTTPTGYSRPSATVSFVYNKDNANTTTSYTQHYWSGTVPRSSSSVSFLLTQTVTTGQTVTSTFSLTPPPLTNTAGELLAQWCFSLTRKTRNGPWLVDTAHASCYYPFDEENNPYSSAISASAPIPVKIISFFDPWFYVQKESEGSMYMIDGDVILVDPNTPTLLGIGIALFVIGLINVPYFCCYFVRKEEDETPGQNPTKQDPNGTYADGRRQTV